MSCSPFVPLNQTNPWTDAESYNDFLSSNRTFATSSEEDPCEVTVEDASDEMPVKGKFGSGSTHITVTKVSEETLSPSPLKETSKRVSREIPSILPVNEIPVFTTQNAQTNEENEQAELFLSESSNNQEPCLNNSRDNQYERLFEKNLFEALQKDVRSKEKQKKNITILKTVFLGLLILGIVCSASFFLLPAIGAIAGAIGLSVAATMIVWETVFLSGGLTVALSFIPKRLLKKQIQKRDFYHNLIEEKTKLINQREQFNRFLTEELINEFYQNKEKVVSHPKFVQFYYDWIKVFNKQRDLQNLQQNINMLTAFMNPAARDLDVEKKLVEAKKTVDSMQDEIDQSHITLAAYKKVLTAL